MNDEKWYSLLEDLEERLGFEDRGKGTGRARAVIEWVVFQGPQGRMKLERTTRPVVIDRKVQYSKRIGGDVEEELVFSETEKSHRVALYRWRDGVGWDEVDFRQLKR